VVTASTYDLASIFAVGGRRAVVSWPIEVLCFALGATIAVLTYRAPFDSIFYPEARRELAPGQHKLLKGG
jgi:hypothetical protein